MRALITVFVALPILAAQPLVKVNVVVRDHQGNAVAGLKQEDFEVTEKGRPQQIVAFAVESPATSATVILLDSLNTSFGAQTFARKPVIEFVSKLKPGDHIGIYQLGPALQVLHEYTADCSDLVDRLRRVSGMASGGFDISPLTGIRAAATFEDADPETDTRKALELIANHLAGVPGRKSLIWISSDSPIAFGNNEVPRADLTKAGGAPRPSFTRPMDEAIRALNNAGVAVYPVDAGGPVGRATQMDYIPNSVPWMRMKHMLNVADRTGGNANLNTSPLQEALRDAVRDSEVTYTFGYHSSGAAWDGTFREIKVKVKRPSVKLRYRQGYFAIPPMDEDAKTSKTELASAAWSPLDATALPISVDADVQPNAVLVSVHVGSSAPLDVLLVQKNQRGEKLGRLVEDKIESNYQILLQREPSASILRVVVRDPATGAVGSRTIPYIIPE